MIILYLLGASLLGVACASVSFVDLEKLNKMEVKK